MSRDVTGPDLATLLRHIDQVRTSDPRKALLLVDRTLSSLGPTARKDLDSRARLHRSRGHALRNLNDFAGALAEYRKALSLFKRSGNATEEAVTQIGRVDALMYRGRYREALAAAAAARRVFVKERNWLRLARLDSNTGNLYHRWDRPADALRYYDRSRRILSRLGEEAGLAIVDFNRGNVLAFFGRFEEADQAYRNARSIFASLGQELMTAKADYGIGYLYFLQERITEALAAFDALRPGLEKLGEKRMLALCDMDSAEILLRLNLWTEAGERARRAARAFRTLDMRYEEARSLAFLGVVLMKTGRSDGALAHWRRAGRLFEQEGNQTWRGVIALQMARLERVRGRAARARTLAEEALAYLKPPAPAERRAEALLVRGALQGDGDRTGSTRRFLLSARRLATRTGASWLIRDCEEELGELARREGRPGVARRHFLKAVDAGERLRSLLHGDDFRAAFLRDRARPYLHLASLDLEEGRVEEAYRWVERGRSRALLEGLDDFPRRPSAAGKNSPEYRELETILRRLGAQYHEETAASGARPSVEVGRLPDRVRRHLENTAEELIGRIYPECGPGTPAVGRRSAPDPAIDLPLTQGEAVISYCEVEGSIVAFVRTRDGLSVSRDLASAHDVALAGERLAYQWGRFRLGRDLAERHARLLLDDVLEDLGLLHGLLVAPLSTARDRASWIVIPSRSMAAIPFAALHDGTQFLAQTVQLATAPSAGVFARCRERLRRRPQGSLIVGQTGPATPEVGREVKVVSQLAPWHPVNLLAGKEATVEAVSREARGRALIHLASHGFFHVERPRLSGIRLADRWLHAHDTLGMELSAELVILSACQSGVSLVLEGDEWMGLPRAFLRAGAARVLASLWDVDDRATRNLMSAFFGALGRGGQSAAGALRLAQLQILEEYRHPYFWAGFQLLGTP